MINKKQKIKTKKKITTRIKILQILKNNPFFKNKKVGIAVSGGVDSMVLLDVFKEIRKDKKLDLYALHYNHKWRKNSHRDANLVRVYCNKNQINFVYKEPVSKVVKKAEEEARNQRYSFFEDSAKEYNLEVVCTAHHRDDQIETILFRLARGTGPEGLLPIKESLEFVDGTKLFRPFLHVTKKQIQNYARSNDIPYTNDETNDNLKYKRNLIRKKIIPLLVKVNKGAVNNILICSDLVYSQKRTLEKYFCLLLRKLSDGKPFVWNRKTFFKLDEYMQKAFIYWFLTLYGIPGAVSKTKLIKKIINTQSKLDLNKNYILNVTKGKIIFEQKNKNKINKIKRDLYIEFLLKGKTKRISMRDNKSFVLKPYSDRHFNWQFPFDREKVAYVDLSRYKGKNLTLRYRKPHDLFQPLGFSNFVKLKKYLINKKISKESRYNLPLLCMNNEVLWIPGYSVSEKLKVLNKPTHILEVR